MKRERIIVCDDEKQDRAALVHGIRSVWGDARIEEADSAPEVLESLERDPDCDFIFLDIYMEKMDGIELGRILRKKYPFVKLVFVSDSREFGPEAFELNAVHYLLKPYRTELLEEIRNRFGNEAESYINVLDSASHQEQKIPCRLVSYIESAHNYVYIHLEAGTELKVRTSMQNLEKDLDDRFLRINRGIIVNMDMVERMNSDSCEIEGKVFLLSRSQRQECRKKYNEYIFLRYMEENCGGGVKGINICSYVIAQFAGYLIQTIPMIFLFYAPYRQEMLRYSKRKILIFLVTVCTGVAMAASAFLGVLFARGVAESVVVWIANIFFWSAMVTGTVVYFLSFWKRTSGKILFYMFVLEYGIALYIINTIGVKFIRFPEMGMMPYDLAGLLTYAVSTAVTFPIIYRFLRRVDVQEIVQMNKKNLRMITGCSIFIVLLTMAALQMEVGLSDFFHDTRANIYESVLLICLLAANIVSYFIYFFCMIIEREKEKIESQLMAYELQYENYYEGMKRSRQMYHNMRHHFRTLGVLAAEGRTEEVKKYIGDYLDSLNETELRQVSRNPVVNSVLSYYIQQAEEEHINVQCDIQVKDDYSFEIKDMTVLLGNAMENALKAARGCETGQAFIRVMIRQYKKSLLIKIENRISREAVALSKSHPRKGYGLASIEMIAKKYDGTMDVQQTDDVFTLKITMNILDTEEKGVW